MNEFVFSFMSYAPGLLWLALFVFPKHRKTHQAIDIFIFVGCLIFVINLLPGLKEALPIIADPSLPKIRLLLSSENGAVGTWTQLIIGDLWIGRWISQNALENGIPHFVRIFLLLVTLLFGPAGLFLYLITLSAWKRRSPLLFSRQGLG